MQEVTQSTLSKLTAGEPLNTSSGSLIGFPINLTRFRYTSLFSRAPCLKIGKRITPIMKRRKLYSTRINRNEL